MRCDELIRRLEELSPISYAESWDNPGLLAGRMDKEIKKIYVALDATTEVIDEAIRCGADMLLTHHPLIFKGIKKVNSEDYIGRRVLKLLQADICYYAMHTNFDVTQMACEAAGRFGIENGSVLDVTLQSDGVEEGIGRVGTLANPMTLEDCAEAVKWIFGIEWVKVFGDMNKNVSSVAISPGSGKSMIETAIAKKADVLITGDIDHHDGIDALERGMAVIDAGHWGLEKIFIPYMQDYLEEQTEGITVICDESESPFKII